MIQIIQGHAQRQPSHDEINTIAICDRQTDNYLLIDLGWGKMGRVHDVVIHAQIIEEKIWIEIDGTEDGITPQLLELGIPKEQIVLGFMRPKRRELTEFAIA
ncbi:MAG: element excision factor XisI family protein [Cyanobacteria bacterium P01_C01_bin.89]